MAVRRGDKWEGRLKIGGRVVKTKRFTTKRAAVAWEVRVRAAYENTGYDPSSGKVSVAALLEHWREMRAEDDRISESTRLLDGHLAGYLPTWFTKLNVNAVSSEHVRRWLKDVRAQRTVQPLAPTSKQRLRGELSSFFSWLVAEGYVRTNPVAAVRPPKDTRPSNGMRPFSADQLEEAVAAVAQRDATLAKVVKVLGWTGLRWGEARSMRVRDFARVPIPLLNVTKNHPEGVALRSTKSGKPRHVGVANEILPVLEELARGKGPDDLLLTTDSGGQLWRSQFVRKTNWDEAVRGRTLHDLRHTAACLWLTHGVPLATVQAWLGHASITMTSKYLHHLGDVADRAALDLLNHRRGDSGGSASSSGSPA